MMITKDDIREQCSEIFSMVKSLEKGHTTNTDELEKYIAFECGKLHLMAIIYAENDKHGLNPHGMETLREFDCYDDPVQYVLALQILIFKMLNLTEYSRETIIKVIKERKIQYITYY